MTGLPPLNTQNSSTNFRWNYVALPFAVLFLALALVAYFLHLLPNPVAYHFNAGVPDRWMERGLLLVWVLGPQFALAFVALCVAWAAVRLARRFAQVESAALNRIVALMGNMIALPQLILLFAMLDIFSYNSYQIHLLPLWALALIVMLVGTVVLGLFFVRAVRGALRSLPGKTR